MKKLTTLSILLISLAFVVPAQASAATSAGVTPGSFFYFFDTTFENISLFFTFDSENKARKALEYADERLAEIEAVAEEKNPNGVKTAIANYESNIALATEKSKEVKDKGQAESLLTSISDNTAKNQEVLAAVLIKVPEEAREAITRAIEVSRKGQEEATRQITELKKELSELKQELENLKGELKDKEEEPKAGGDKKDEQTKAVVKLKSEIESLKKKVSEPSQKETKTESKKEEPKNSIVNLPSGAVVEMDVNGNIIRTIKEAPVSTSQNSYTPPQSSAQQSQTQTQSQPQTNQTQTSSQQQTEAPKITSVNISPNQTSATFEWQTDKPTQSKIFISGVGLSAKIFNSASGLSTRHIATVTGLLENATYTYEIEAIAEGTSVVKKQGSFETLPKPVLKVKIDPVSYSGPVPSASLSNKQIPMFTSNTPTPKLRVKMDIYTTEHGLSFDYLQLNGVKFQKISDNVTQNNGKYATSTYEYTLSVSPTQSLTLTNVLYNETYPYPNFELTLTLEKDGEWVCLDNYSSCEFPTFPITNVVTINPRSQ